MLVFPSRLAATLGKSSRTFEVKIMYNNGINYRYVYLKSSNCSANR